MALNAGLTQRLARAEPPGMTIIGTPRSTPARLPPNEFSMPGPPCMQKMPTFSPELQARDRVGHVHAGAFLPHDDRPDVRLRRRLDQRVNG